MSDMLVSEVLRFQTFEKPSPHLARGISHRHEMVSVGKEKRLLMQLMYFYAPGTGWGWGNGREEERERGKLANAHEVLIGKVPLTEANK